MNVDAVGALARDAFVVVTFKGEASLCLPRPNVWRHQTAAPELAFLCSLSDAPQLMLASQTADLSVSFRRSHKFRRTNGAFALYASDAPSPSEIARWRAVATSTLRYLVGGSVKRLGAGFARKGLSVLRPIEWLAGQPLIPRRRLRRGLTTLPGAIYSGAVHTRDRFAALFARVWFWPHGRHYTIYAAMAQRRLEADAPLFTSVPVHPVETEIADLFSVAAD